MENRHTGKELKLSWNPRVWFAKNFRSFSTSVRGSIGKGDGLVPSQEYNEGREGAVQSSAEEAYMQQLHRAA